MYITRTPRLAHCNAFIVRGVRIIQHDHCVSQLKMKITVKTRDWRRLPRSEVMAQRKLST